MKFVLALLCLTGALFSVDACSLANCALGSAITGSEACGTYTNYINCLNQQKSSCTDSALDQASLIAINAAIDSSNTIKEGLKCSAGGLTVSVVTILMPVMIALFKS